MKLSNADFKNLLTAEGTHITQQVQQQHQQPAKRKAPKPQEAPKKFKKTAAALQDEDEDEPMSGPPSSKRMPMAAAGGGEMDEDMDEEELEERRRREELRKAYPDRAAERRRGKGDVAKVTAEFKEQKQRSIEESKFLGGDVEHTHLVKGLDFALLAKIRAQLDQDAQVLQMRKQETERQAAAAAAGRGGRRGKAVEFKSVLGESLHRILFQTLHPHHVLAHKRLRQLQMLLLQGRRITTNRTDRNDFFSKGKSKFLFAADDGEESEKVVSDLPEIVRTSSVLLEGAGGREKVRAMNLEASEGGEGGQTAEGATIAAATEETAQGRGGPSMSFGHTVHGALMKDLSAVLQWHQQNRKKKRQEREDMRPPEVAPSWREKQQRLERERKKEEQKRQMEHVNRLKKLNYQVPTRDAKQDLEQDIFADAGEFDPVKAAEEAAREMAARGTARGAAESGPGPVGGTREEAEGDDDGEAMDVDEEDEVRPVFGQTQTALASERAALEMRDYFASSFAQQQAMQGGMGANQMQMQGQYRQDGLLAQPSHGGRAGDTLAAAEREKHVAMQSRAAATLFRRDDASALRRTAQPRLDEDDDYMECYPAFAPGVSNEAYDSDEEDRTQMDMGRLKPVGAKSRHDFQSKEDWEKYQLNKEALPKAAFQFGKKSAELQGGKKKGGKLNEEQQWKKIQKMHSEGKTKSMDQVG